MDLSPFKQDTIGHMINAESLSCRLGGLYCLYCLYETQPFEPPFKVYLSLGMFAQFLQIHSPEWLFTDTGIERCIHMDLGMEVDFDKIKTMSTEYAVAKRKAIEEVGEVVDVQNIKQITEDEKPLSEIVEKIDESWNNQREAFYRWTGLSHQNPAEEEQPQLQLKENEAENDDGDEFYRLLYEHD